MEEGGRTFGVPKWGRIVGRIWSGE